MLEPQAPLQLPSIIDFRVIDRLIVTLKELDLWGLSPELSDLHVLIRKKYEELKNIILGQEFTAVPMR